MKKDRIITEAALRPCKVGSEHTGYKDALFHTWVTETMFNGSIKTYAILELMDGSVIAEFPRNVRFLDSEERFYNKYFYEGE